MEQNGKKILRDPFYKIFDWMSVQRNLKAIGTFAYQYKILGNDRTKPNFIPDAVRMLLFGPGVTYMTKLYALIAKINSQVIIKFSRECLQTV